MDLVDAHVHRFNNAVRHGDWEAFGSGFTADATVSIDYAPIPPMVGREAIVAGYRAAPPDDTITVLSTSADGDTVSVTFAWDTSPGEPAGTMDMRVTGGLISSLKVGRQF
ncbi:hypothetical protein Lesp02_39220 [Lentzea sp. NBRC 105346]|uniref:nuclear transport factor 2 family protein n=1 Tax=Lentzea sp. NBRC 105346 TaxID=3032205 RepID=UPI0024A578E4|nr:nuclear transport factor 2 family protein [Lentzea sp. NBRC 105346]GLZ31734.1 hypothetical protein Lesp02_39220 [Lentzea sp. NBRC 105346]